jgi:hypothetical protein
MASLIAKVGPTLLGEAEFEAMLAAFQRAVKEKTPEALADLVAGVRRMRWRELPEAFGPLARDAAPECLTAIATPGVDTDLAIVVLQSLISRMEAMSDRPYRVEHDKSKNLERYHDLLQRLIAHEDSIELRQTAIASFKFPLKLTAVTQVDSKASAAVQLADVMVGAALGAANCFAGLKAGGLDPEAVIALYKDEQFIHLIPDVDFENQRQFRKGTQAAEVIEYFAQHFAAKP